MSIYDEIITFINTKVDTSLVKPVELKTYPLKLSVHIPIKYGDVEKYELKEAIKAQMMEEFQKIQPVAPSLFHDCTGLEKVFVGPEFQQLSANFGKYIEERLRVYRYGKIPSTVTSTMTDTIRIGTAKILNQLKEITSSNNKSITLYVARHPIYRHFLLTYNPDFMLKATIESIVKEIIKGKNQASWDQFIEKQFYYFVAHEMCHILFGHLGGSPEYNAIYGKALSNFTFDSYINEKVSAVLDVEPPDSCVEGDLPFLHYYLNDDKNELVIKTGNEGGQRPKIMKKLGDFNFLGVHVTTPYKDIDKLLSAVLVFLMEKGIITKIKRPKIPLAPGMFVKTKTGEIALVVAAGQPDPTTGIQPIKISVKAAVKALAEKKMQGDLKQNMVQAFSQAPQIARLQSLL